MLRPEYPIETERLLLRPYREDDIDVLHDIQSHPEVVRYLYWEPRTREQVEKVIRESSDQIDGEGGGLTLAIQPRAATPWSETSSSCTTARCTGRARSGTCCTPTTRATVTRPRPHARCYG